MNKEVNGLMKQRRIARERCKEKDKEIEELNDLLHKANDEVVSYANECIRLNNIINELEKWLEDYFKLLSTNADMLEQAQCDIIHEILDKLKELKEGK